MKKHIWEVRIPTLAALFLTFLGIWVTLFMVQKGVSVISQASPDTIPRNIQVTNVTDSSFTVSFTTTDKTIGAVSLLENDSLNTLILDDRDKPTGSQKAYSSHHITVPNLKPNSLYKFSLLANSETILDKGKPFSVTTSPKVNVPPPIQNPLFGKVLEPNGASAEDALIYVSIEGAQKISALSKKNGEYIIPTNSILDSSLSRYLTLSPSTSLTLEFFQNGMYSKIALLYKDAASIPPINLSQNYNFNQLFLEDSASSSSAELKTPVINGSGGIIKILAPQDGASLIDDKPSFKGVALSNKIVKISIHSANKITAEVVTDAYGYWSFRPTTPLAPGLHTITIETVDKFGIIKRITQSFSVYASGSQLTQTATPSATPLITAAPIPTAAPTPVPTAIPTAIPTIVTTPTISPVSTPSSVITPIIVPSPTSPIISTPAPTALILAPTKAMESPGGIESSLVLTLISAVFIISGGTLLFVLR